MKLDATDLRYVTPDEFRVLMAVRTLFSSSPRHLPPHVKA
jgi:hypothetical protein